jgi:hypothetical protein
VNGACKNCGRCATVHELLVPHTPHTSGKAGAKRSMLGQTAAILQQARAVRRACMVVAWLVGCM